MTGDPQAEGWGRTPDGVPSFTVARAPSPPAGRRTREALRAMVLEAGVQVLLEDGLGSGAEQLTFKRVFERVAATTGTRVTNASVIGRIWANQAEYQSAVLAAVVADEVKDLERAVATSTAAVIDTLDRSTMEGRQAALRELIRRSAEADLDAASASRSWAAVIGIWALATGSRAEGTDHGIYDAIRRGYDASDARGDAVVGALLEFLGLRLRPPLRVDQFTVACSGLVDGCALRARADPGVMRGILRPTGPGGADQEWTLLGIAMEALADQFFEFDPGWVPAPTS